MSTSIDEKALEVSDLSGQVQRKTSKFMQQSNEVDLAVNEDFKRIGGFEKIPGYSFLGNAITTVSTTTSTSTSTSSTTSTSTSTSSSTSTSTSTSSTTTI
jgi:hypothetical protein